MGIGSIKGKNVKNKKYICEEISFKFILESS